LPEVSYIVVLAGFGWTGCHWHWFLSRAFCLHLLIIISPLCHVYLSSVSDTVGHSTKYHTQHHLNIPQ